MEELSTGDPLPQGEAHRQRSGSQLITLGELRGPTAKEWRQLDSSDSLQAPKGSISKRFSQLVPPIGSTKWSLARVLTFNMMASPRTDFVIGLVIIANSITVGIEQSFRLRGWDTGNVDAVEHIFLSIYVVELSLRIFGAGFTCLQDCWVQFDLLLIVVGSVNMTVEALMGSVDGFAPLMVLRTLRLLRLARTVRLLGRFRVLWMLVRGLLNSAGTMLYTMVLLVIIMYIFSCIAMEIITHDPHAFNDPEFKSIVDVYFNSLPVTMLTMIQFVCLDSVGAIYKPLVERNYILVVYFAGIILIVPVVLMNLVTAVIVNGALEQALLDKEAVAIHEQQKRKKLVKDLRKIFHRIDTDDSGKVTLDEILEIDDKDMKVLTELTSYTDPYEIFHALDLDTSGEIDIDEFCDGVWQVVVSKAPVEMRRMEKQCNEIHKHIKAMFQGDMNGDRSCQEELKDAIFKMQEEQQRILATFSEYIRAPDPQCAHNNVLASNTVIHDAPPWAKTMLQELRILRREMHNLNSDCAGQSRCGRPAPLVPAAPHAGDGFETNYSATKSPRCIEPQQRDFRTENDILCKQLAAANDALLDLLGSRGSLNQRRGLGVALLPDAVAQGLAYAQSREIVQSETKLAEASEDNNAGRVATSAQEVDLTGRPSLPLLLPLPLKTPLHPADDHAVDHSGSNGFRDRNRVAHPM